MIEKLLKQLESQDPSARREAAMQLAGTDSRAIHPLVKALWDRNPGVQEAAVNALASFADEATVWAVAPLLREDAPRRNMALEILTRVGPPAVPLLKDRLDDKDPDVRKFVVDIFGTVGGDEVVEPLRKALKDANPNVRASAAKALGLLGIRDAVPDLIEVLDDEEWVAFSSLEALGSIADEEAVLAITRLLEGDSPTLRMMAVEALGEIQSPLGLPALFRTLGQVDPEEKKMIARSLVKIGVSGTHELASVLMDLLREGDREDRIIAARGLTTLKSRRAVPVMVEMAGACDPGSPEDEELYRVLTDAIVEIGDEAGLTKLLTQGRLKYRGQVAVINALGRMGSRSAVKTLMECLHSGGREVRRAAARAQSEIPGATADDLITGLVDEDGHVRRSVAKALGAIGDPAALPSLMELIKKEPYPDVLEEAVEAAFRIDENVLDKLARNRKSEIRQSVARLARGKTLVRLVGDQDPAVRMTAVLALGQNAPDEAGPILRELSRDPDPEIRKAAVRGLGFIGDEGCRTTLIGCLQDEDMWVRMFAVDALSDLEEPRANDGVRRLLKDAEGPVRVAAVRYLGRYGNRQDLAPLLRDPDDQVRQEAQSALAHLS